ncbi:MAG: hypothetical protein AAF696_18940 [Bacteroidota bacterium]
MKTSIGLSLLLLIMGLSQILAQENYKTYENQRFEYCLDIPINIFEAQKPPENGDGRRFLSTYGDCLLLCYGGHTLGNNLQDEMYLQLEGDHRGREQSITYKRISKDFFILSGYVDDRIFYHRTHLENEMYKTFYLEYPQKEKERFDKIISHMVQHFPNCPPKN